MKIIMYGAQICPECVEAKAVLEASAAIELEYIDITSSTKALKEFLFHRDQDELFAPVIKEGKIGIPFFLLEDGRKTFEVYSSLGVERLEQTVNSCSIDGKGQC